MEDNIKQHQTDNTVDQIDDHIDKSDDKPRKEELFTKDQVNEIVSKRVNKLKEKYADYDEIKKQLAELLEEKKKREEAELSEIERLKKYLGEKEELVSSLQQEIEKMRNLHRQQLIESAFKEKAREAGIEYVSDALRLADLSGVEIDGDEIKGIDEVVEKLVKEKPFLLVKKNQQRQIGGPTNFETDKEEKKSKEEQLRALAEKARKTGRIEDRVAYALMKKKLGL